MIETMIENWELRNINPNFRRIKNQYYFEIMKRYGKIITKIEKIEIRKKI